MPRKDRLSAHLDKLLWRQHRTGVNEVHGYKVLHPSSRLPPASELKRVLTLSTARQDSSERSEQALGFMSHQLPRTPLLGTSVNSDVGLTRQAPPSGIMNYQDRRRLGRSARVRGRRAVNSAALAPSSAALAPSSSVLRPSPPALALSPPALGPSPPALVRTGAMRTSRSYLLGSW